MLGCLAGAALREIAYHPSQHSDHIVIDAEGPDQRSSLAKACSNYKYIGDVADCTNGIIPKPLKKNDDFYEEYKLGRVKPL